MDSKTSNFPEYSEEQLKGALDSLLQGSKDPSFDGRHLFGFGDANHKLSKLQAITATRILDYNTYLVRSLVHSTTTTTKTITTCFFFLQTKYLFSLSCLQLFSVMLWLTGGSIGSLGRRIKI